MQKPILVFMAPRPKSGFLSASFLLCLEPCLFLSYRSARWGRSQLVQQWLQLHSMRFWLEFMDSSLGKFLECSTATTLRRPSMRAFRLNMMNCLAPMEKKVLTSTLFLELFGSLPRRCAQLRARSTRLLAGTMLTKPLPRSAPPQIPLNARGSESWTPSAN